MPRGITLLAVRWQNAFSIEFRNSRADVVKRVGTPEWERLRADGSIAAQRWPFGYVERYLHITYSSEDKPCVILIGARD
jgi:hypothetical protein